MLGDAALAGTWRRRHAGERRLRDRLFVPVVPQGKARIRMQISAAHTRDDLEFAVNVFADVKRELGE